MRAVAAAAALVVGLAGVARADEMVLPVVGPVSGMRVLYRCFAGSRELGLPEGNFPVLYVQGGGNSVAVVPIGGRPTVMVQMLSADGARFAAGRYVWWDRGQEALAGSVGGGSATCHRAGLG